MPNSSSPSLISGLLGIFGIWLVLKHFPDCASSVFLVLIEGENIPESLLAVQLFHFAVVVLLGLVVIAFRNKVASWLSGSGAEQSVTAPSFLAAGSAVIGLYFTAAGVINIGEHLGISINPASQNGFLLYRGLSSIFTGLILLLGSVGISRAWSKLKGLRQVGV
ncbi:hypothetical protein KHP57_14050 [Algiphilus sp. NNCM1]|nr:hypothetical protein [Algiphilus acroporae]